MKKQTALVIVLASLIFYLFGSSGLVSALNIDSVSINPQEVAPGKSVEVKIVLENNLDDDVSNVDVSLNLASVPFAPEKTTEVFFNEILSDKSKDAIFDLIANSDAESGVYKIPLAISYDAENGSEKKATFISITINGKPELSLNADNFLLVGNNKLTIKITNSGLAKAKFLELNAQSGAGYSIISASKVYIGDLNSDDFDTFSLDIYAKNTGIIILPIEVKYRDFANNDYTENFDVPVRVYSQDEALQLGLVQKSNTGVYVGLGVLIVVLYIAYSRLRKWQRKKKANSRAE